MTITTFVRLSGLVVNALDFGPRGFASRPCHYSNWVATLGKLFTHIASPVPASSLLSSKKRTGVQKGLFGLDPFNGFRNWLSALD